MLNQIRWQQVINGSSSADWFMRIFVHRIIFFAIANKNKKPPVETGRFD